MAKKRSRSVAEDELARGIQVVPPKTVMEQKKQKEIAGTNQQCATMAVHRKSLDQSGRSAGQSKNDSEETFHFNAGWRSKIQKALDRVYSISRFGASHGFFSNSTVASAKTADVFLLQIDLISATLRPNG